MIDETTWRDLIVRTMDETWDRRPPLSPAASARWYTQLRDRFTADELLAAIVRHGEQSDEPPSMAVLRAGAHRYRREAALERARAERRKTLPGTAPAEVPAVPREMWTAIELAGQLLAELRPYSVQVNGRWARTVSLDEHEFELLARHIGQHRGLDGRPAPGLYADAGCPVCRAWLRQDQEAAAEAAKHAPPAPRPWEDVTVAGDALGDALAAVDPEAVP